MKHKHAVKLFIDDLRDCPDGYIVRRSYESSIDYMLVEGCPNHISFDHDLGEEKSGLDIVKWIIETDMDFKGGFIPKDFSFNVHSANPVGKENIISLLTNYLNHARIT